MPTIMDMGYEFPTHDDQIVYGHFNTLSKQSLLSAETIE